MTHILVFNTFLGIACCYALARGGAPERLTALMLLAAAAATYLVPFVPDRSWRALRVEILLVDLALMGGLVAVAVRAARFWPIWLASLHLLTLCVHALRAVDPRFVSWMYGGAIGKIAYPMLLILMVGTARHRARLRDRGTDPDWSGPTGDRARDQPSPPARRG